MKTGLRVVNLLLSKPVPKRFGFFVDSLACERTIPFFKESSD
jgi:hypothetical protein